VRWPADPAPDGRALELLGQAVRADVPRPLLASAHGLTDRELDHLLVGELRSLAGLPPRAVLDVMIASFLLGGNGNGTGNGRPPARQLWAAGVDPVELHELELVVVAVRSMPDGEWAQRCATVASRTNGASTAEAAKTAV
jgi:hypothetical protein